MNKYLNKLGEDGDNMNNKGDIELEVAGVCIGEGIEPVAPGQNNEVEWIGRFIDSFTFC